MLLNESNNSELNIVFVADIIDGEKSGGVISAKRLIDYLKDRHPLKVLTTGKPEKYKISLPAFYLPFVKNIMQDMGFIFAWPKRKTLENALKDADLVHIQFPFLLGYRTLSIARKMGKPVVLGFHVQPENLMWNIGLNHNRVISFLYRFFVKTFYNKGDIVLSPSSLGKIMLEENGINVPVEVISNGLPEQFKPGDYDPDPKFKDKFVILMAGRLAREKRHDAVIQAIQKSKHQDNIQLVVTGKGHLREELEQLGESLAVPPLFTYVSQKELIRLFNTAHLFIHASEVELEGMAVLEAIGCGLPALIANSDASASNQFAINEKFLFSVDDTDELSSRIDYWYENRSELVMARKQYLEKVQQYSFTACAKKTEVLYRAVIAETRQNFSQFYGESGREIAEVNGESQI